RLPLTVDLGPDRVFVAPPIRVDGTPAPCDPAGGPFVEPCQVLDIIGDKTVRVVFRVRFAYTDDRVNPVGKYIASHRWSMTGDTKENGRPSRHIDGRVIFRLDMLEGNKPGGVADRLVADQFRRRFLHRLPDGMIRKPVSVQITADGREATYQIVDQEVE